MTTQPTPCNVRGRAMPPPLRSISSRMLGIISSSSAALRSEEEETTSDKNTTHVSGTATASEICNRALHVSAQQEEQQHQSRRSSHRRASSFLSTRSSQGEERRRSSLYSVGSNILSDLSSVADEMMSSLALEAADTTSEVDQPTPTRPSRRSSHRTLLNAPNGTGKHDDQSPIPTTSRPKRHRASFHYPGVSSRPTSNRRSSCSSMLSIDSEQSEIHHRHQVYLQTTRRRHSSLYDVDDEHEDNVGDGDDDDMLDEEVGNASDVENMAIHRPGTSLAGNDAQESVRDLTFFEDGQFEVVDGLVTLSSSPINSVASRAG